MLRLLTDENFNADVIHGMRRRETGLDIIGVEEVGLRRTDDRIILEHAAALGRTLHFCLRRLRTRQA